MCVFDWADFKEKVKQYADSVGINKIGFTDAQLLKEHLPRLLDRKEACGRYSINEGDPHKRVNPLFHMPEAKSVISTVIAYPWQEPVPGPGPGPASGPGRGRMSLIARGTDYHVVVRTRLEKLREYILSIVPQARLLIMVDKEEILEKALAVKAGLGWFGKNTLLVTPEYGSWVCLGELVTDLPFPVDRPLARGCGNCRECIESCPTKALDEDINLNPDRCLAGITLGKFLPPPNVRILMGDALYGCDICQLVCPLNSKTGVPGNCGFGAGSGEAYPVLSELFGMTNAEFRKRFGHTSAAWRGRTPIQRNALIAAGNLKDTSAVPGLIDILSSDSRPVIRGAAAWALGQIGSSAGVKALQQGKMSEDDPTVLEEIENSQGRVGSTE